MSDVASLDLVILVADKNQEALLKSLLEERRESLAIRSVRFKILVHPQRDPGVFQRCEDFLRGYLSIASRALVLFDYEGCGQEGRLTASRVRNTCLEKLRVNGWSDRAEVVVLCPELEAWCWSRSRHLETIVAWKRNQPDLWHWLGEKGFLAQDQTKPQRPKEAMEEVLRETGVPRSSSVYREIARHAPIESCVDRSFLALRNRLRAWFPLT